MAKHRDRSIREQCDHCRHFTGIGNEGERMKRTPRGIDVDAREGRGFCAANVFYNDVMKQGARMIALPCFHTEPDNMPDDGVWPTCPKQSFKTAEELDAEAKEINDHCDQFIQRMTIVRPAILKHAKRESVDMADDEEIPAGAHQCLDGVRVIDKTAQKDARGSFECPICKTGTLRYSVSGYNGHIHAKCSTENCVAWME